MPDDACGTCCVVSLLRPMHPAWPHLARCPPPCRGAVLEQLLAKVMGCEAAGAIQVICMSATMSGLDNLCTWLAARLFLTNFRPVPLAEHAVFKGAVYLRRPGSVTGEGPAGGRAGWVCVMTVMMMVASLL